METNLITTILISAFWIAAGAAAAFGFIWTIRKNAEMAAPENHGRSLALIILGAFLRLLVMGILMYIALRMRVLYVLLFVLAFTVSHFILVVRMKRSEDAAAEKEEVKDA